MTDKLLELKNITREFGPAENRVKVLKGIDLTIHRGEFVAIIGQSGSGKTTLMNILGCLDTPTSGSCRIDGEEMSAMDGEQLARLRRRRFGFIFQRYNLLGALNARDNVALPSVYAGMGRRHRLDRAQQLLQQLGLAGKELNRPAQLSGGQQQRVSIARALMNGGSIILADEPTGALDSESGAVVMEILDRLHSEGHTIILVTHDAAIAARAERTVEIKDGEIIADTSLQPRREPPQAQPPTRERRGLGFYRDQLLESLTMSLQAIVSHKLRSLLTMLGIIIGIASVVSVVALGRGSEQKILGSISEIGTNTVAIFPGEGWGDVDSGRIQSLTVGDAEALGQQRYLVGVSPETGASGKLTWRTTTLSASLEGGTPQFFALQGLKLAAGRFYNDSDVKKEQQVVVIDSNTCRQLFAGAPRRQVLGRTVLFNRRPLVVIGVTKPEKGAGPGEGQLRLFAPWTTVMHRITGDRMIGSISAQVADDVSSRVAEKAIVRLLTSRHGRKDFFTMNSDSIKKTIQTATGTMTLLISAIAVISLLVGGIGVMNIMLVSVTERTGEIGLRSAIGARRSNILQQFLIEAMLICLAGGLFGVGLSVLIAFIFNQVVTTFAMSFSLGSIVLAVLCSTAIGVLFGFMPARRAAGLRPVEALARE